MSNPTLTIAAHISDSAQGRAAAFVPVNQRVTSTNMPLSVQADVPTFPGTSPALTVAGTWTVAGSRVTAGGIPVVNTQSVGVGYTAVPASSGPLQILPGNQHVLIAF
ncbi:hypothetical protein [Halomonas stenophila]|uniref:Uncharacterized protein n=1 Tax=Halomonas stenophila TaxID=795312 RepID=A0A7W5HMD2_9GAMM|nr:hypothetical protein [Halomonas stenophila]MBB3232254.1 hypothetical protein [Halomonas stenophila]